MSLEIKVCLTALCLFFFAALLTGVWKYVCVMRAPNHRAPIYVDIAHHAAMHYSFAVLVLMQVVQLSGLGTAINLLAAGTMLFFFALAILTYIGLGLSNHTDNQFAVRNFGTTAGMYALIAGEVGGFLVLSSAALWRAWFAL